MTLFHADDPFFKINFLIFLHSPPFFFHKYKSLLKKYIYIDIKNNCLADKIALHVLFLFVFNVDFLFFVELCPCPSLHKRGRNMQNGILDLHANKITSDDVQVSEFM